jgi:hypothetical protein
MFIESKAYPRTCNRLTPDVGPIEKRPKFWAFRRPVFIFCSHDNFHAIVAVVGHDSAAVAADSDAAPGTVEELPVA